MCWGPQAVSSFAADTSSESGGIINQGVVDTDVDISCADDCVGSAIGTTRTRRNTFEAKQVLDREIGAGQEPNVDNKDSIGSNTNPGRRDSVRPDEAFVKRRKVVVEDE